MDRAAALSQLLDHASPWDIAVIGGGATGVGVALDAAARGYSVCLLEQADFGKGTSSRSTKLIHGGVRYLQQGNVALVIEALKERGLLRQNAPHLVHDLAFIVPNYTWWEAPFYGIGMKVYDLLAGTYGFGKSHLLRSEQVLAHIPTLERASLRGGVIYYDGQFDDARLLINLTQTAQEQGAVLLNYAPVDRIVHDADGFAQGLNWRDLEDGREHTLHARCIVNATGAFSDDLRRLDDPAAQPMIAPSQGVHLVLDRSFLPGDAAIMVPHTRDGRVMFAIPWLGHTLLGTTDTPLQRVEIEPVAQPQEIDFILQTAAKYLARSPARSDILSVFAGIRPLVRDAHAGATAAMSREHTLHVSRSGMLSIAGGKWTTYRKMAEDTVDYATLLAKLDQRPCPTHTLRIHGFDADPQQWGDLAGYGADAPHIQKLSAKSPELAAKLHPMLPIIAAQVIWAARCEMARTVEDVLARRTRALFLNARAAMAMAEPTARLMADELHRDAAWQSAQIKQFTAIAQNYLPH